MANTTSPKTIALIINNMIRNMNPEPVAVNDNPDSSTGRNIMIKPAPPANKALSTTGTIAEYRRGGPEATLACM